MSKPLVVGGLVALFLCCVALSGAFAEPLLTPGDPIIAIDPDPPHSASDYPDGEPPANILDGDTNTKYLNFSKENSGFIVTPSMSTIVQSFVIWTANDAPPRDPASWELYGTNEPIVSTDDSLGNAENWILIDAGAILLPDDRFTLGPVVPITGNSTSYSSYRMVFPTLKDSASANSMQISEVDMYESADGSGADVLAVGNPILAIDTDVLPDSSYPPAEAPAYAIDGSLSKYLNFGKVNSGFIVTPSVGAAMVTSFQITTANDSPERDPTDWMLYGTNDPIVSTDNSTGEAENWTLVDSGTMALSDDREVLGPVVPVDNTDFYSSYKILFTGVKDAGAANSMQIAEIQFDGTAVPEPSTWVLLLAGLAACGLLGRRRLRAR